MLKLYTVFINKKLIYSIRLRLEAVEVSLFLFQSNSTMYLNQTWPMKTEEIGRYMQQRMQ